MFRVKTPPRAAIHLGYPQWNQHHGDRIQFPALCAHARRSIISPLVYKRTLTSRPRSTYRFRTPQVLRLILGGGIVGAGTLYYVNNSTDSSHTIELPDLNNHEQWFTIPKHGETFTYNLLKHGAPDHTLRSSTHLLRSASETEEYLRANEKSTTFKRPGNPIIRIDENVLACNQPCEDRHSIDMISRSALPSLLSPPPDGRSFWDKWTELKQSPGQIGNGVDDLVLVSVFDGHCNTAGCSELLQKTFHPCIAWMIGRSLASGGAGSYPQPSHPGLKGGRGVLAKSMSDTFLAWDAETILAPVSFLQNKIRLPDHPAYPAFPHPSLVVLGDAPSRGSTATTLMVDVKEDTFYVANTGDSRAVAGWWDPREKKWRCEVLSSDHDARDPVQATLIRAAHPLSEASDVVCEAGSVMKVLGTGQPCRAFGNSSFKHPDEVSDRLRDVLGSSRHVPAKPILTPPYKTAKPDVTSRSIHPGTGEQLKFIVIATDGLWNWMTSEEASLLLTAHLRNPNGPDLPKSLLPALYPYKSPTMPRPYPAETLPGHSGRDFGSWVFENQNAATHLIRNGLLGMGWDRDVRRRVLSMRDGLHRVVRDDTTVVVVHFDSESSKPT